MEQPQHRKSSSSEAHRASRLQDATPAVSGRPVRPAYLQITHERKPGPNDRPLELTDMNSKPRHVPEGNVSEDSTEYHVKLGAPHPSEGEVARLELERQLSVSLAAQTERDHRIAQLTDELALKSALLEQAEANAVEAARRVGPELREHADDERFMRTSLQRDVDIVEMQAKLDELILSRNQQIGQYEEELANVRSKLEAKESELEAVRLRLADADRGWTLLDELVVSRDRHVGQYEKELTIVIRAKLEAKESESEAVRLRLPDVEKGLTRSKAEADTLRTQTATGFVNRDEGQVARGLMERVRDLEVEMASKRWNEKCIAEMECRNEG